MNDNRFNDMRLRVVNSAPCPIQLVDHRPDCFPYGTLYISKSGFATFGDLSVPVNLRQAVELMMEANGE